MSDLAHVISADDKDQLEAFCTRVDKELGVQFALVTIDSIGDQPIRDFALQLGRKWGVGAKGTNQGVLLLLAIKDHKSDIDTGRGIEPYITDGFAGSTLRAMRPQLQGGDYGAALLTAARTMADQIAQGKGIAFSDAAPQHEQTRRVVQHGGGGGIPGPLIILGIFVLIWLLGRGGRRGGGGGFWTGILLGNLLGGGRGGWGGGGWGGGGFGGGSSGSGGFGGFGGGDFGGGGASSSW